MRPWELDNDNIPALEGPAVPFEYAMEIMDSMAPDTLASFSAVRVARAYDRKDRVTLDGLGENRNPSYSSEKDAYVIQVSIVVDADSDLDKDLISTINSVDKNIKRNRLLARQAELMEKKNAIEVSRNAVDTELAELESLISNQE